MSLELNRSPEEARDYLSRALRNPDVADDRIRDHVRLASGPQPYAHSYYSSDRFFAADSAAGVIRNVYGQRMLRVTGNFFRSLHRAIAQVSGERSDQVLFHIGYRWGQEAIKSFVPRLEQEFECEFEKLNMAVMLESWWWPSRASGWGVWRCDFGHAREGLVLVDLSSSPTAEALGRGPHTICSLEAGLFAALFGHLAHRELGCVELECSARGSDRCRFLVATPGRVETATRRRDEGAGVDEIVRHLASMAMV